MRKIYKNKNQLLSKKSSLLIQFQMKVFFILKVLFSSKVYFEKRTQQRFFQKKPYIACQLKKSNNSWLKCVWLSLIGLTLTLNLNADWWIFLKTKSQLYDLFNFVRTQKLDMLFFLCCRKPIFTFRQKFLLEVESTNGLGQFSDPTGFFWPET